MGYFLAIEQLECNCCNYPTTIGFKRNDIVSIGSTGGDKQHYRQNADSRSNKSVQEFCPNNFAPDRKIKEACIGLK
jgi:hypothetical protein